MHQSIKMTRMGAITYIACFWNPDWDNEETHLQKTWNQACWACYNGMALIIQKPQSSVSSYVDQEKGGLSSHWRRFLLGSNLRLQTSWRRKLQLLIFANTGQSLETFILGPDASFAMLLSLIWNKGLPFPWV